LRERLRERLPKYMVPAAVVVLEEFPLTANGKLDRPGLPAPDEAALVRGEYEVPQGEIETTLAQIWRELLRVERVGRQDNFFELGGHSLLIVQMMERLRRVGLTTDIRELFAAPTLADLAAVVGKGREAAVPANVIREGCEALRPSMLPLVQLDQASIDRIIANTPGGLANIQDIYALSPLQDGILFHYLLAEKGDPYLLISQLAFPERGLLDRYLAALQQVVDRHDILRTAFQCEGLSEPVQVVWRQAA